MGTKEVFEAVGLGTPFYLAAATYGFFHWLDSNASRQATRAVSAWFRGEAYRNIDVKPAIVAIFDRIYSSPLFTLRALLRSAVFTITVWIAYAIFGVILINAPKDVKPQFDPSASWIDYLMAAMLFVTYLILVDYASLFIIRRCLNVAQRHIILPVIIAFITGISILLLFFYIQFTIGIELLNIMRGDSMNPVLILRYSHLVIFKIFKESPFILMGFAPAFFVHLWLPLFAFGALSVRIIYPVFRFIEWAQWFLKQGNQHPLRAVGIVAAALVFMGAMICRAVSAIA